MRGWLQHRTVAGVANLATRFEPYEPAFVRGNWLQFEGGQISGIDIGVGPNEKGELLRKVRSKQNPGLITHIGNSHTDTEVLVEADTAVLFHPDECIPDTAIDGADTIIGAADMRAVQNCIPAT